MKKNYNQPQTEIVSVELANMIMSVSSVVDNNQTIPPGGVD
jgi:hypothetical protein